MEVEGVGVKSGGGGNIEWREWSGGEGCGGSEDEGSDSGGSGGGVSGGGGS